MTDEKVPWTQARKETLEQLVSDAFVFTFYGYQEQLLDACADILAESNGNDLVFVGRSPENIYDLLDCLLDQTRCAPKLTFLPFSLRTGESGTIKRLEKLDEESIVALESHFEELNLSPAQIAASDKLYSFVDCVGWGTTFCNLEETLVLLATRQSIDPALVTANVRYIGITKESLGWTHWRNDEGSKGAKFFAEDRACVVTVSAQLWSYLAERSEKTMESFQPDKWKSGASFKALNKRTASAVRQSVDLLLFGRDRASRRAFASKLSQRADDKKWLRSLVVDLLKSTQLRRGNR